MTLITVFHSKCILITKTIAKIKYQKIVKAYNNKLIHAHDLYNIVDQSLTMSTAPHTHTPV